MKKKLCYISNHLPLIICIAGWSFSANNLVAQDTYNLNQCLEIALEKNFNLQIVRNKEAIDRNNYTRGNAGYLPIIDAGGRYSGSLKNTESSDFSENTSSTNNLNANNFTGSATLAWDLFAGFRISASYGKLGEIQKMGELNTRLEIENLIGKVVTEYYGLIYQKLLLANFVYILDLSKERLRITNTHYELGSRSKLELLQAKVDYNTDSSRVVQQEQQILAGEIRLLTYMGVLEEDKTIVPQDTLIPLQTIFDYKDLFTKAMDNNVELLLAARRVGVSELDLKIVRSQTLPYLRLNSAYAYNYSRFNKGSTKMNQSFGPEYGLTFGINIFDGANRRREIRNARYLIENRVLEEANLKQDTQGKLQEIYASYKNNYQLFQMEKENFETAKENFKIASSRYMLGELSGIELREAQNSLRMVEERLLNVKYAAKIDEISLLILAGQVMEYM